MSVHEDVQLRVLDVLLETEDGVWTGPWQRVLTTLAQACYGSDACVGSPDYKRVSLAVLSLEKAGLVSVDRAHEARAKQANVILSIATT